MWPIVTGFGGNSPLCTQAASLGSASGESSEPGCRQGSILQPCSKWESSDKSLTVADETSAGMPT